MSRCLAQRPLGAAHGGSVALLRWAGFGALATPDLEPVRLCYLDSIGLFASLGNRLLLQSAMPKPSQIAFWDRVLVRMSRLVDPLLGYSAGKSVLAA